jgi:hypothetical protein
VTAQGTCALFEDGSVPILAGQRPIVLDAFITHRLQTEDPRVLQHLLGRIERGGYRTIALTFPLTNIGWFQTLDFGSAFVAAVEKNYHLTATAPGFFLYVPRHPSAVTSCNAASLDDWH